MVERNSTQPITGRRDTSPWRLLLVALAAATPCPPALSQPAPAAAPDQPAPDGAAVAARVQKIIVEHLGVDAERVLPRARFAEDLGADSLDMVELIMAFEEQFSIEIPEEDCTFKTVGEATAYLRAHAKK